MGRNGFTLIELLVVIGIVAVLSVLAVPNFLSAREKARDTQRKSDLKQIQSALELYKNDQVSTQYPATLPVAGQQFVSIDGNTLYMRSVPGDPLVDKNYRYIYNQITTLTYTLTTCLENKADPTGTNCPALPFNCSSSKCYSVSEP